MCYLCPILKPTPKERAQLHRWYALTVLLPASKKRVANLIYQRGKDIEREFLWLKRNHRAFFHRTFDTPRWRARVESRNFIRRHIEHFQ